MIQAPKGTKDILPRDVYLWHHIEDAARKTAEAYAFKEIRTPVFEHTELFVRGVGDTTDIVNKEMYTFLDKGGRSITLRPEGTAGVARAFIENGLMSEARSATSARRRAGCANFISSAASSMALPRPKRTPKSSRSPQTF